MNKRRLIERIMVSPFILGILIVNYTFGCIKHFIGYLRWGGEWITYKKDDPARMKEIFEVLKDTNDIMRNKELTINKKP